MPRLTPLFLLAIAGSTFGQLIPQPVFQSNTTTSSKTPTFVFPSPSAGVAREIDAFRTDFPALQSAMGRKVKVAIDPKLAPEQYKLSMGSVVQIRAGSRTGVAWALQSLGQIASSNVSSTQIEDKPSFPFRCVMIDVARRYHSLSTLRQIVRWCQAGKVRFIQLHLTDDQNWMLPTTVLAGVDKNNAHKRPTYTRQELTELQAFASARGVTIIPEIDIPGHSSLLVKLDPEQFQIKGSQSTGCINFGSPRVRQTMRKLIAETASLFKESPYIHIGGDEAWYPDAEKDPIFAQKMKSNSKTPSPSEVFVDFVGEMSEAVLSHKKRPIVWEGFGRTDFARTRIPSKTIVVAWEGDYYPAKDLANDGYNIINAGWDPCYVVNHYPYDQFTLAPLPNLYQIDPFKFGLFNRVKPEERSTQLPKSDKMLGSLMCWWEGHEWNAHTTLPNRIIALGSKLWHQEGESDYRSFSTRMANALHRIQTATQPFDVAVEGAISPGQTMFTNRAIVRPVSSDPTLSFAFRTDTNPPKVDDIKPSLEVSENTVVTIQAYRNGTRIGEVAFINLKKVTVVPNLAMGAKVIGSTPQDPQFPAQLVTDGVADNESAFWLGYAIPCSLTIDLGAAKEFNRVDVVPFWAARQAVLYKVETSLDASTWTLAADASTQKAVPTAAGYVHRFAKRKARYVRVQIMGTSQFPPTMARINEVRVFDDKKPASVDMIRILPNG
ncbi:MAG TPA: family 20 glycosylhydrolase [Fimbriimonas sp.]|nr:family 20 glycosylhydrolase [Fimbriimonas sp.]